MTGKLIFTYELGSEPEGAMDALLRFAERDMARGHGAIAADPDARGEERIAPEGSRLVGVEAVPLGA